MKDILLDYRPFKDVNIENRFVAFVDILGFGQGIRNDFESVLDAYEYVLDSIYTVNDLHPDVSLRIYSDALLLTSTSLGRLIREVQSIQMHTLFNDCLVRGGIGYGKHIEVTDKSNLYVVSQALVQAVEIEKTIKYPCVALHESIEVPMRWWQPDIRNIFRGLLYFDGLRIVNPFNMMWGTSAATRVNMMLAHCPEHKQKYEWFLRLFDAVMDDKPLILFDEGTTSHCSERVPQDTFSDER